MKELCLSPGQNTSILHYLHIHLCLDFYLAPIWHLRDVLQFSEIAPDNSRKHKTFRLHPTLSDHTSYYQTAPDTNRPHQTLRQHQTLSHCTRYYQTTQGTIGPNQTLSDWLKTALEFTFACYHYRIHYITH